MSVAIQKILDFWTKYESLNLKITFILISLQILHLYWLTADVVLQRIAGESYLGLPRILLPLFIIVDYVEIPALVSGITFYLFSIFKRKSHSRKNVVFLLLLAIQVIHIFWITDEVVYESLLDNDLVIFPVYAAWTAILIDYLEIPVMVDLFYKTFKIKRD
ncbi:MAG: hypothetical protein K0R91_347 [Nitrososphaeraceae archaeon]|jgi:hypothetical protein|nr:hypothetical protein [Nitrososphaeraceae archaeon]